MMKFLCVMITALIIAGCTKRIHEPGAIAPAGHALTAHL
jgi:hypothetical protein